MDHRDDFEQEQLTEDDALSTEQSKVCNEAAPQEIPPVGITIFSNESKEECAQPQWYSVTYQNRENDHAQAVRHPLTKRSKMILLTVWVLVFALVAAVSGYVGAMMYQGMGDPLPITGNLNNGSDNGGTTGPGNSGTGGSGVNPGGDVFDSEGNEGFAYDAVVLQKNDGTTLVGSTNGSAGNNVMSKIDVVAAVKASVVEITTTTVSNFGSISAGAGSGVIIHAEGIIVTNNHVIEEAEHVYVRLTNGNTYEATVRGTDEDGDIAVIKIDPREELTVAKLGYSGALVEGEEVIAIGNPLGELGGTVTNGIISQVEREVQMEDVTMTLLQTNAAINSGNSGGGLFNMAGELIGIVNAKYSAAGVEGLGFAIPIDTAVISIGHLLELGYIPGIPSLGVTLAEGTVRNGFSYRQVVYVYDEGDGSVFGYQDIFVSIEGVSVSALSEVKQIIRSHSVGDVITLVVLRNNQEITLAVTLVEQVPVSAD